MRITRKKAEYRAAVNRHVKACRINKPEGGWVPYTKDPKVADNMQAGRGPYPQRVRVRDMSTSELEARDARMARGLLGLRGWAYKDALQARQKGTA